MTAKGMQEPHWSGATAEPLADMREAFEVVQLRDRAVLYEPGQLADRLYLVRSGRLRLVHAREGLSSTHAFVSVGDVFGGDSVTANGTLGESAIASGEAEVWSFGIGLLPRLFDARPQLAVDLVRGLALRQRELSRRVEALATKEVPARLAGQLLALADALGEASTGGGSRDIRGVTQQDLADLVGASRSFISTLVNELRRDGVLGASGRTLVIRDVARLRTLAALNRVSDSVHATPKRKDRRR